MNPCIRHATAADAAALCAIYNHYVLSTCISFEVDALSVADMEQRIADISARFPWQVHEEQGRILGYAYASQWKPRRAYEYAVESSIYLVPDSAGKGIGSGLYSALLTLLKQAQVHVVMAGIAMPNAGSVALHEKMGFAKVGHFEQVGKKFEQWIDVAYWQLILGS